MRCSTRIGTKCPCALDGPDFDGEGVLWGGNLALVSHLVGTPHLPNIDGGILFLEETNEHPYRIERMLWQLHFAGVLARQKAVLLGTFNGYELADNDNGYDEAAMVAAARARFGVPIVHRAAVRALPRQADAARRRALQPPRARRGGPHRALRLSALSRHAGLDLQRETEVDGPRRVRLADRTNAR